MFMYVLAYAVLCVLPHLSSGTVQLALMLQVGHVCAISLNVSVVHALHDWVAPPVTNSNLISLPSGYT